PARTLYGDDGALLVGRARARPHARDAGARDRPGADVRGLRRGGSRRGRLAPAAGAASPPGNAPHSVRRTTSVSPSIASIRTFWPTSAPSGQRASQSSP